MSFHSSLPLHFASTAEQWKFSSLSLVNDLHGGWNLSKDLPGSVPNQVLQGAPEIWSASPMQRVQGSCSERGVAESLQRLLPPSRYLVLLSTGILWLCRSYSNNLFHSKPFLA